jgi:putative transcriptional regulator
MTRGACLGQHGDVPDDRSTAGRLLISSPSMSDGNFDRTVVFVLEHASEGALGVVLNRPTPVAVGEAVPQWQHLALDPGVVFLGGPVAPGSVLALARADRAVETPTFTPVLGRVGVLDISGVPDELDEAIEGLRLFTGYSGWGPGQLDQELAGGAWFVVDAEPDDPLTGRPDTLWTDVLNRQDGRAAMRSQDPRRHWLN